MKQVILRYGLIIGALLGGMMLITMPFLKEIGFHNGEIIGYTTMILGFSLIYFALISLKKENGGKLTFGQGFKTGLLITLIASAIYSLVWVILSHTVLTDFATQYGQYMVESMKKSGATDAKIQTTMKQVEEMRKLYQNPIISFFISILEPLPVGVPVSVIAALIARSKKANMAST